MSTGVGSTGPADADNHNVDDAAHIWRRRLWPIIILYTGIAPLSTFMSMGSGFPIFLLHMHDERERQALGQGRDSFVTR